MDNETIRQLQECVNNLEKRIDFLYSRWNIPPEINFYENDQFRAAVQKGDKIEAIKIYRLITNSDLSTAKKAVEDIWPKYNS